MNILNLAIDQESLNIIQLVFLHTKRHPFVLQQLVNHRFGLKGIQAVHQAMSKGNSQILKLVCETSNADLNSLMTNQLSTMHCAA